MVCSLKSFAGEERFEREGGDFDCHCYYFPRFGADFDEGEELALALD